jgi:hypothetical protein
MTENKYPKKFTKLFAPALTLVLVPALTALCFALWPVSGFEVNSPAGNAEQPAGFQKQFIYHIIDIVYAL